MSEAPVHVPREGDPLDRAEGLLARLSERRARVSRYDRAHERPTDDHFQTAAAFDRLARACERAGRSDLAEEFRDHFDDEVAMALNWEL